MNQRAGGAKPRVVDESEGKQRLGIKASGKKYCLILVFKNQHTHPV